MPEQESLSDKVNRLNRDIKCPMGRKQVLIHGSILRSSDAAEPPEIKLRCKLRSMRGDKKLISLEYIEAVCARDPMLCPDYRKYCRDRRED